MIFDGRPVTGEYKRRKYNVAVSDRKGLRWTWRIKYYYDEKGAATRRAKALTPMYGAVRVIPPNTPTKGNHVKRRA